MRRWAFSLAAAVSLLLCVATAVLWVRSYWVGDGIRLLPQLDGRMLLSARGSIAFREWEERDEEVPPPSDTGVTVYSYHVSFTPYSVWVRSNDPARLLALNNSPLARPEPGNKPVNVHALGFIFRWTDTAVGFPPGMQPQLIMHSKDRVVGVPHAAVALLTGIMPALWLRRARVRRQSATGLCRKCGYDIRATRDRCPECGTIVPAEQRP